MLPAEDAVTPHLRTVRRRKRDGDAVVMHVQPEEQRRAGRRDGWGLGRGRGPGLGRARWFVVLRLDTFWVAEYVGLHGVGSFGHFGCLGRESHHGWLGVPPGGSQPTLIPERRHRFRSQQKPY